MNILSAVLVTMAIVSFWIFILKCNHRGQWNRSWQYECTTVEGLFPRNLFCLSFVIFSTNFFFHISGFFSLLWEGIHGSLGTIGNLKILALWNPASYFCMSHFYRKLIAMQADIIPAGIISLSVWYGTT